MVGKICMVTGANSGIGKVTALELARKGSHLVMLCRSRSKGEQAQAEIKAQTGNEHVDLLLADFASLSSVRRVAGIFKDRYGRLDVLVNNAGLYVDEPLTSQDGFEMTFAVNHLAPFLLTNLLLDLLKSAPAARVVTVSSGAHMAGHIRFDRLGAISGYNGFRAYADSKLANVLFSFELARRLDGTSITSNCLHPGAVATNFAGDSGGFFGMLFKLGRFFYLTPEQGAQTSIYLASSPEVEGITGKYFINCKPSPTLPEARDPEVQRRLWEASEQMVGLH